MKIFNKDGKINFVDDNNVFVGFDFNSNCCENFGYSLRTSKPTDAYEAQEDTWHLPTDDFVFDVNFFEDYLPGDYDSGGAVCFRLTNPEGIEIFLTLYNSHNGYYSHGFSATIGANGWQGGYL